MNPDKPQKPQTNYGDRFDRNDDISVSYEEISPEEQSRIKRRAESPDAAKEVLGTPTDIWSADKSTSLPVEEVEWQEPDPPQNEAPASIADSQPEPPQNTTQADFPLEDLQDSLESPSESDLDLDSGDLDSDLSENKLEAESPQDDLLDAKPFDRVSASEGTETTNLDDSITDPTATKPMAEDSPSQDSVTEEEANGDREATNIEPEPGDQSDDLLSDGVSPLLQEPDTFSNLDRTEPEPNPEPTSEPAVAKSDTSDLIAAKWLDDVEPAKPKQASVEKTALDAEIAQLQAEKTTLLTEIAELRQQKEAAIAQKTAAIELNLAQMIQEGTRELKDQKNRLLVDIEKLERRKQRIDQEMRETFVGSSQDLAMRIQGFKKYLVGSLQDLSTAAEKLELPPAAPQPRPSREPRRDRDPGNRPPQDSRMPRQDRGYGDNRPYDSRRPSDSRGDSRPLDRNRPDRSRLDRDRSRPDRRGDMSASATGFGEQAFDDKNRRIRQLLDQYRTRPDYYGAPWQLRRTFEQVHSERVQEWFFGQGGRGTIKGMGSRLQNILVASAIISVSHQLYRDRCRVLVLVDSPEKLGEWRRGLCDCLGISRNDFGANRGIDLFDSADILVKRAERLIDDKLMPLVVIDEAEGLVNLGLLKFPLWLAFSEKPQSRSSGYPY